MGKWLYDERCFKPKGFLLKQKYIIFFRIPLTNVKQAITSRMTAIMLLCLMLVTFFLASNSAIRSPPYDQKSPH